MKLVENYVITKEQGKITMQLDAHFKKFLKNLALDETRANQARAAHQALESFLRQDEPVKRYLYETFLQGSYEQDTIIRPIADAEEFDVDVVVSLNVNGMPADRQTPEKVVAWLKSRIVSNSKYVGIVRQKNRCIRITFSRMFHLDIVAAHGDTRHRTAILVPDRDLGQWIKSHPKGYTAWLNSKHQGSGQWLKSTVMMVKWWRNLKVGANSAPKSIVLQTLLAHRIPTASLSHAHAIVTTLESLWELLGRLVQVPRVMNPSVPDENLARDWSQEGFEQFKEHLQRAGRLSRRALDHTDLDRSIDLWRELFGERFPVSP